jgi:molybdopterin biosynthesis enzyme
MVPRGADAVVMVEHTEAVLGGDRVMNEEFGEALKAP